MVSLYIKKEGIIFPNKTDEIAMRRFYEELYRIQVIAAISIVKKSNFFSDANCKDNELITKAIVATFLDLDKNWLDWIYKPNFLGFLYGVLRNKIKDEAKKTFRKRDRNVILMDFLNNDIPLQDHSHKEPNEKFLKIKDLVYNRLSSEEKNLFVLKYEYGFSYREISIISDLPLSTIKGRGKRLLATIRLHVRKKQ